MKTRDLLLLTASAVTLNSASGVYGGLSEGVGLAVTTKAPTATLAIPDFVEADVQQSLLLPVLPSAPVGKDVRVVFTTPVEANTVANVALNSPAAPPAKFTPVAQSTIAIPDNAAKALAAVEIQITAASRLPAEIIPRPEVTALVPNIDERALAEAASLTINLASVGQPAIEIDATNALPVSHLDAETLGETEPGLPAAESSIPAVRPSPEAQPDLTRAIRPDNSTSPVASGNPQADVMQETASAIVTNVENDQAQNVAASSQAAELNGEAAPAVLIANVTEAVAGGTTVAANVVATAVSPSEQQAAVSIQKTLPEPGSGQVFLPDAPEYISYADAASSDAPSPTAAVAAAGSYAAANGTVSLENAISAALETNPEINQAIFNKEAIEFEREQAQGLFSPRVDLEASVGARRLENPTRRTLGIQENILYPVEGALTVSQTLVDFGRRKGELRRQAARTDGAALRVVERSQNVALLVSRQYLNILLQQRVVAAADDNVTFHRSLVGDLGQGVAQGSISIADQQQAEERLQAAVVRKTEAEERLTDAQITLQTLTGLRIDGALMPRSLRSAAPPTLGEAVAAARQNNPKVQEAIADVDAAHALASKEKGDLAPTISAEIRGRGGNDIDGFTGRTTDVQGRIVLRWNLFDGGINRAKYQEMVRRASEARYRMHEMTRLAEQDVQRAWNSMKTQAKISDELAVQSRVSDDLLLSYRQQFNVGRRSLLDVLDAQNTRYNVQVRLETARFSKQFAEYQVLAATNELLDAMGLSAPASGAANAREKYQYGPSEPAELQRRRYPR